MNLFQKILKDKALLSFSIASLVFVIALFTWIVVLPKVGKDDRIDTTLPKDDQTRQGDLLDIQDALITYGEENSYPIFQGTFENNSDLSSIIKTKLNTIPKDPDFPNHAYFYQSMTGKTFTITAVFSDNTVYTLSNEYETP